MGGVLNAEACWSAVRISPEPKIPPALAAWSFSFPATAQHKIEP